MNRDEKRWLWIAAVCWAAILVLALAAGRIIHRRAVAIVTHLVSADPKAERRSVYLRLEADRLVKEALERHEAAGSKAGAKDRSTTGSLIADVHPLLEQAERLYLEYYDAGTSPATVLFPLAEVNLLMGRQARGFMYLSCYWEAQKQPVLAEAYRRRAAAMQSSSTSPTAAGFEEQKR